MGKRGYEVLLVVAFICGCGRTNGLDGEAASAFFNCSTVPGVPVKGSPSWMYECMSACKRPCLNDNTELSLILQLTRWSRDEDCSYRCFSSCQVVELRRGGQYWKSGGKWGHTRLLGLQEPAAVVFSLANGAAHVAGFAMLRRARATAMERIAASKVETAALSEIYPHLGRQTAMAGIWTLAWMASAVFHCRDNWKTERLDYYSGNVAMACMLFTGLNRCGWDVLSMRNGWVRAAVGTITAIGVGAHMVGNWKKMDYTRNMWVMISMMVLHSAAWITHLIRNPRAHNYLFYLSNLLVYLAGALELKDFAPVLGSVDAHALWHAATPPLSWLFYKFLSADCASEVEFALNPPPPLLSDKSKQE